MINKGVAKRLEKDLVDLARGRRRAGSVYREAMNVYDQLQQRRTERDSSVSGSAGGSRIVEKGQDDDLLDNDSDDVSSEGAAVLLEQVSALHVSSVSIIF